MIRIKSLTVLAAVLALSFAAVTPIAAQVPLEVSITNLTRGQIMSNPLVITHDHSFSLFELGEPASVELAIQAEDGDAGPLTGVLDTSASVFDYAVAGDAILPGDTMTVIVDSYQGFRLLTVSGMLVSSNDAFFSVQGLQVTNGTSSSLALAYDAGSEGNAEHCDHIPGPPCGNPFVPNLEGAEGFVHVHAGIHGIADLAADEFDWRNPVARVVVRRLP